MNLERRGQSSLVIHIPTAPVVDDEAFIDDDDDEDEEDEDEDIELTNDNDNFVAQYCSSDESD